MRAGASSKRAGGADAAQGSVAAATTSAPKKVKGVVRNFEQKPATWKGWHEIFFSGTEFSSYASIFAPIEWDFDHLRAALSEGGELAGKQVYLFGCTEPQLLASSAEAVAVVTPIPVIIAVETSWPLPDVIALNSIQAEQEEIVPMAKMKMGWIPFSVDGGDASGGGRALESSVRKPALVRAMQCSQRLRAVKGLAESRVRSFEYCLPYIYRPEKQEDEIVDTIASVAATVRDVPIVCEFDWDMDDVDEFSENLVSERNLPADSVAEVKAAITDAVRAAKKAIRDRREERAARAASMPEAQREALKTMRVHKFYPQNTVPDTSGLRTRFINRYFGHADALH